jgi:tight adherence protein C
MALSDLMPFVLVSGAILCAFLGVVPLLDVIRQQRRLVDPDGAVNAAPLSVRRDPTIFDRLFGRRQLGPANEQERSTVKLMLTQAGYDSPNAVQIFYGIRLVLAVVLPILGMVLVPLFFHNIRQSTLLILLAVLGLIGYLAPPFLLSRQRSARHQQLRVSLPDILDLLVVCTEAGLGLDMAIARVAEEAALTHPLLARNLRAITRELQAGRGRADALRAFSHRTGIAEINSLVQLLIQSDALGTSMAQTLRTFAADMRAYRLTRVEELANKAVVKMAIVLVGLLMPALLVAILAPVVRNAVITFSGLNLGGTP